MASPPLLAGIVLKKAKNIQAKVMIISLEPCHPRLPKACIFGKLFL
jgi:hypothetical protein